MSINSSPSLVRKTLFSALQVLMRHHRVRLGVPNPSKAPLSQAVLDLVEVLAAKNGSKCQQPGFRNLLGSLPGTVEVGVAGDESLCGFFGEKCPKLSKVGGMVIGDVYPMNKHLLNKVTCKQCSPLILSRKENKIQLSWFYHRRRDLYGQLTVKTCRLSIKSTKTVLNSCKSVKVGFTSYFTSTVSSGSTFSWT